MKSFKHQDNRQKCPIGSTIATLVAAIVCLPTPVLSQVAIDSRGDYYSVARTWTVVLGSGRLNCRSEPGTGFSVLTSYSRGASINTFYELGGSNIQLDNQGRPWIRIKWAMLSEPPCYVRASNQFIRPNGSTSLGVTPASISSSTIVCADEEALLFAGTQNYLLYICGGSMNSRSSSEPMFYEGRGRTNQGGIRLSLTGSRFDPASPASSDYFIAVNGDTIYRLNRTEISVTRGSRTVLRERIKEWCTYPGVNNSC